MASSQGRIAQGNHTDGTEKMDYSKTGCHSNDNKNFVSSNDSMETVRL